MALFQKEFTYKIHSWEFTFGIIMLIFSIILPKFFLYLNFPIYDFLEQSIELWDKELLIYAMFHVVFLNILRAFPIFFAVFLLLDSIEIFFQQKENYILKIILAFSFIQFLYFISYKIYFDMPYYFGKVAILEMFYLIFSLSSRFKSIGLFKRNLIQLLIFIGIQWLDITSYFSFLDYKSTGELLFDLKSLASLMESEKLFNLIGFLFFLLFFLFSVSLLFIFSSQENQRKAYEKEKLMAKTISSLKIQELENRYLKEIQYLVHDLKTPLFSISTLVEILDLQEENLKKKSYYKQMEKSLDKCNIMVSEILRDDKKNPISIDTVFTFILSYMSTHSAIKHLYYANDCKYRKIHVNKILFSRAIINLILNAYESYHGLDSPPKIEISLRDYFHSVLIKIEDYGRGISKEEAKEIFTPGFSSKNSTGLGLNFVKSVMEEHHCKLSIFAKEEGIGGSKGSIVYILMKGEILNHET